MATFLDTTKIQKLHRITLGFSALRNLGVEIGEVLEIYFDENEKCLLIKPIKNNDSGVATKVPKLASKKKKKQ